MWVYLYGEGIVFLFLQRFWREGLNLGSIR
jgi:hypothetical protein